MKKILLFLIFIAITIAIWMFLGREKEFEGLDFLERKERREKIEKLKESVKEVARIEHKKKIERFNDKQLFEELERATLEDKSKIKRCNKFVQKNVIPSNVKTFEYEVNEKFIENLIGNCLFFKTRRITVLALLKRNPEKYNEIVKTKDLEKEEFRIFDGLKAFAKNQKYFDETGKGAYWTYITVQLSENNINFLQLLIYADLVQKFLKNCEIYASEEVKLVIEDMQEAVKELEKDQRQRNKILSDYSRRYIAEYEQAAEYQKRVLEVIRLVSNDVRKCIQE